MLLHHSDSLLHELLVQRHHVHARWLPGIHFGKKLLHTVQQDVHVERLGDVVIGPLPEALQLKFLAVLGGEKDHWDVGRVDIGLDGAAQLHAVHVGHHHVADHQVHGLLPQQVQHHETVRRTQHLIALRQARRQEIQELRVVVHQEDRRAGQAVHLAGDLDVLETRLGRRRGRLRRADGNPKREHGAVRGVVRNLHRTLVHAHILVHQIQADTAAAHGVGLRLIEHLEHVLPFACGDAGTRIGNLDQ